MIDEIKGRPDPRGRPRPAARRPRRLRSQTIRQGVGVRREAPRGARTRPQPRLRLPGRRARRRRPHRRQRGIAPWRTGAPLDRMFNPKVVAVIGDKGPGYMWLQQQPALQGAGRHALLGPARREGDPGHRSARRQELHVDGRHPRADRLRRRRGAAPGLALCPQGPDRRTGPTAPASSPRGFAETGEELGIKLQDQLTDDGARGELQPRRAQLHGPLPAEGRRALQRRTRRSRPTAGSASSASRAPTASCSASSRTRNGHAPQPLCQLRQRHRARRERLPRIPRCSTTRRKSSACTSKA